MTWREGRCQAEEKSSESKETRGGRGGKGERGERRKEKGGEKETKKRDPISLFFRDPLLDSQRSWVLSVGMGCVRKG